MKNSIIWTTAGVIVVGFGVPAYAAISSATPRPTIAPAPASVVDSSVATSASTPSSVSVSVVSTPASMPTISVPLVTTANSTANSVEDISGNCDEAEHANDANCAGVNAPGVTVNSTPTSVDDNSGPGTSVDDNSGPGTTVDDNSGRGGNSGHGGGSDGSGHGGGDDN